MAPKVSKHIKDGVTQKQRKLAKNLAKGMSKADAHRKAGYNSNNPTQDANKQLQNPKVVEVMVKEEQRLEKIAESKLDNDTLIDKHVELLHAQDESGNNNYGVQQGALRDAYRLKRAPGFGTERVEHAHLVKHEFLDDLSKKYEEHKEN